MAFVAYCLFLGKNLNMASVKTDPKISALVERRRKAPGLWSSGICECSSHCSKCILATFLPCFQFGENYALMHKLDIGTTMDTFNFKSGKGDPYVNPRTCGCCVYGCCTLLWVAGGSTIPAVGGFLNSISCLGWCMNLCLHTSMRNDLRERQGIRGNCCNALCCVFFCYPCALTQEYKELKVAEYMSEPDVTAPLATSGMFFSEHLYY